MDKQEKTNEMIVEAISKGLVQLAIFKEAYNLFPEAKRNEMAEEWLQVHGTPAIWFKCVECSETFPIGYPLVWISHKGQVGYDTPEGFKRYFNERLSIRTCPFCETMHPKAEVI